MIHTNLEQISKPLQGELIGPNTEFKGVSIDTRKLSPGMLFIAIQGENHDGHDFVEKAMRLGAKAVVVSKKINAAIPQLVVKDTRIALGDLARWYRQQFTKPVIALTGSCGKTTTKALITNVLSEAGRVHATVGNLNNDYGVPLTLLSMPLSADFAVIEMGANHPKEIAYLTHIARPDIAFITNAGPVHLEGFKSIQGVAESKAEIFEGLTENGEALINFDDKYAEYWISMNAGQRFITYGLNPQADIYASDIDTGASERLSFTLNTLEGSVSVSLALLGEHNISNALAAASTGIALNLSMEQVKKGLEKTKAVSQRFVEKAGLKGAHIIDDSYNANPIAMDVALKFLSKKNGQKIMVIGDMGELGTDSTFYHQELGKKAKEYGIDGLYAIGENSKHAVKSFGDNAFHFLDYQTMIDNLANIMQKDLTILIKGSRSASMETVVNALLEK